MTTAALLSVVSMGVLIAVQVVQDIHTLTTQTLKERIAQHSLTSLELAVLWSLIALGIYTLARAFRPKQLGVR